MAAESSSSTTSPPENTRLRNALAALGKVPPDPQRAELAELLCEGPLWLGLRELPSARPNDAEPREWTIRLVSSREIEGATWLCVFADAESAAASAPGVVWVALEASAVFRFAKDSGYAGLLLDPRGAALRWSAPELDSLLARPEAGARRRQALSLGQEPENAIREALERLMQRPYDRACARVREPRTGKHLQFALTPDGALMMDLPRSQLGLDEVERARMLLDDLSGHVADGETDAGDFQALFCDDTGRAAKAAVKVFTWVFGFPPGFALAIDEPCG